MFEEPTYSLNCDLRDLYITPHLPDNKHLIDVLREYDVPTALGEALDYFCQRFFPEVYASERPWVMHQRFRKLLDKQILDHGEKEELSTLTEKIKVETSSWPLAWYWKSLLPGLPSLLEEYKIPRESEIKIRISQIRQWTLALVYREDEIAGIPSKQQTLLRPPLFGRSDRLTLWDQYITLMALEFAAGGKPTALERRWEDAKSGDGMAQGMRRHEEMWYVLGRNDLVYTLKLHDFDKSLGPNAQGTRIKCELFIDPHHAELHEDDDFAFPDGPTLGTNKDAVPQRTDVVYPYDTVRIPPFQNALGHDLAMRRHENQKNQKKDEKNVYLPPETILLASDNVCLAYEQLSKVWNDRTTKSVLIVAPSGSGKELLARSNHLFQKHFGPLIAFALSPTSHDRNDHMLFSRDLTSMFRMTGVGSEVVQLIEEEVKGLLPVHKETRKWAEHKVDQGKEDPEGWLTDGLIFKARKGTLFLDEIDKVPEQTRASLLRLLENDEFPLYGTPIQLTLEQWRPLYVFAGSMPLEKMLRLEPEDFWTRMIQRVVMKHPLEVDDPAEQQRIARSYFHFFWVKQIKTFFETSELLPFRYDEDLKQTADMFHGYYLSLYKMLTNNGIINVLSTMFAEEICTSSGRTLCSIRNIRVATSRVIYGLVHCFLHDKRRDSALRKIQVEVIQAHDELRKVVGGETEWFSLLMSVITQSHRDRETPAGTISNKYGEAVRSEIRGIVHEAVEEVLAGA